MAVNTNNESTKRKGGNPGYSDDVRAYARMLYLLVDEETSQQKYSLSKICDEIELQFSVKKPSVTAMANWAKNWKEELSTRKTILRDDDSALFDYHKETNAYVNRDKVVKAILNQLRTCLLLYSKRMQRYGKLEDKVLEALESLDGLDNEASSIKIRNLTRHIAFESIQKGVTGSNKAFLTQLEQLNKWLEKEEARGKVTGDILEIKGDQVWEFEPVDIEEFLDSDEFLGSISKSLFPCVKKDIINIFWGNPRNLLKKRRFKEIIFKEAYGTGKSERAAIMSTYITYLLLCLRDPSQYFEFLPGSKITVINVSVSQKQAKDVVFSKIKGKIDHCPWFKNHGYSYDPNNKLELRFDPADSAKIDPTKIYKNLYIIPGSSSQFSALGYDVICAIIDEATAYGIEKEMDKAEIIYNTLKGRVSSRFPQAGMIVMAGNPHHVSDFLEVRLKDAEGQKDIYIVKQRSIWEARLPDYDGDWFYFDYLKMKEVDEVEFGKTAVIKIPIIYYDDFKNAPEMSVRNLAGISLESISRFFTNIDTIQSMFETSGRRNPVKEVIMVTELERPEDKPSESNRAVEKTKVVFHDWFKPVNKGVHVVHVDIGVNNDALGLVLGHVCGYEKGLQQFWIDCVIRLKGSQTKPNILSDVREVIYQLSQLGFNISYVTLDGYQSTDTLQILTRRGYDAEYLSVDKQMAPYINLRQSIYEDRVNCPFDSFLKYELETLENVNDKKVDHPFKGSKDISDAMCGVVHTLIEKVRVESITSNNHTHKVESEVEEEKEARTADEVFDSFIDNFGGEGDEYANL
ncbi:MAG: hypothetical protein KAS32_12265 [Candidatus Peribacteraceae bacterium]|nr:hypothetical protein [Candidatus Peribacteraceae bacterium]